MPVVVDALHRRDIDDHPHVGIRNESLEAVPAAGDDETVVFAHRILNRRHDLVGGAYQPHVIRAGGESLVESLVDHRAVSRVVTENSPGSGVVPRFP